MDHIIFVVGFRLAKINFRLGKNKNNNIGLKCPGKWSNSSCVWHSRQKYGQFSVKPGKTFGCT